jgi:hypothetical protein
VNFTAAVQKCKQLNASVLVIEDACEDKFIRDNYLMNSSDIWLGIYDFIGNETNVNYYTNETLPYTYWYVSEPNNILSLCTRYMKTFSQWGDGPCSSLYSVVCKASTTISSTPISTTTLVTTTLTTTLAASTTISTTTIATTLAASITISSTTNFATTTFASTSATSISISKTTNSPSSGWSEWNPWEICTLEKKRRHLTNSSLDEIFKLNISCDLICKYDILNFYY